MVYLVYLLKLVIFHDEVLVITRWYPPSTMVMDHLRIRGSPSLPCFMTSEGVDTGHDMPFSNMACRFLSDFGISWLPMLPWDEGMVSVISVGSTRRVSARETARETARVNGGFLRVTHSSRFLRLQLKTARCLGVKASG